MEVILDSAQFVYDGSILGVIGVIVLSWCAVGALGFLLGR